MSAARRPHVHRRDPVGAAGPLDSARPTPFPGVLGPGRRARWHRLLLRRALAAVLATLAVALTVAAARAGPPPLRQVTVITAARDVTAGGVLVTADLRPVHVPADSSPPGALVTVGEAAGRRVVGPIAAGEVVTATRLALDRAGIGLPDGRVAVHLLVDDPGALDLVRAGALVTLYPAGGGPALTRDGLVVAVDPPAEEPLGTSALTVSVLARGIVVALPPPLADLIFAGQRVDPGPPIVSVVASAERSS